MNGLEPLIPMTLFVSIASVWILRGPIGKALADRISGRAAQIGDDSSDGKEMLAELEEVRYRLTDVEERLDFSERILARQNRQGPLGPAG